ncbi:hypothetical protein QYF61_016144 [Mycteria americana]|uniref:Uncharacterized protein n=1 Tax=Mycteria americana TaxID=33587 RepID=A0AAN7S169_MYCAM|nr:hypothetical protein QYF61_016144 [Mycteria americana]
MPHSSCEREVRKCERNNPADTNISEGGRGGCAPGTRAEIPLQPVEKIMVTEVVLLQPVEDHSGADIHLQPMEDPTMEQAADRNRSPWRGPLAEAGFLERPVADGGPMLEQSVPEGLYTLKGLMLEQLLKNCSLWKGPTLEKFMKDCIPWEGPYAGAEEQHEQEGAAEMKCYGLITAPIPHLPCAARWGGGQRVRSEVEPGRKRRGGGKGWRLNRFPGQPVPMLDNPFSEVKFPNIQSKPPLVQIEAIFSCPITCYLGEETDPHLSTTLFQVFWIIEDSGFEHFCRRVNGPWVFHFLGEHVVTWLLRCCDNGASSLELEGKEAKQLGSLSREGGIDKEIAIGAPALSLWR